MTEAVDSGDRASSVSDPTNALDMDGPSNEEAQPLPTRAEWLAELSRTIERADHHQSFLWNAFMVSLIPAAIALLQGLRLTTPLERDAWLWLAAAAFMLYGWIGEPLVNRLHGAANPRWAREYRRFQTRALTNYVSEFGAPKAGRLVQGNWSLGKVLAFAPLATLLWALEPWYWKAASVFLWYSAIVYASMFLIFLLPRDWLAKVIGRWIATFQAGADRPPMTPEANLVGSLIRRTLQVGKLGKPIGLLLLFLTLPRDELSEIGAFPVATIIMATVLVWSSIRLAVLAYVDPSRQSLEELNRLVFLDRVDSHEALKLAVLIEAFAANRFVLNLPLTKAYERLGLSDLPLD